MIHSAVVGCGAIHTRHGDAITADQQAQLLWVCDTEKERAQAAGKRYDCSWTTDYNRITADPRVDVVHICTPHYLHEPMAVAALAAGKHVLVEKPIAMSTEDGQAMIAQAHAADRKLGVTFQNRYNKTSVLAKELIEKQEYGRLLGLRGFVTWHRTADYYTNSSWRGRWATEGGGLLINQAIHTIDLMQWLAGPLKGVEGTISNRVLDEIEVEDTAEATLFFADDVVGLFYGATTFSQNAPITVELHCEQATLRLAGSQLAVCTDDNEHLLLDEAQVQDPKAYWGDSHELLISAFYRAVRDDSQIDYVGGEDGLPALQLVEAIYRSSQLRRRIWF